MFVTVSTFLQARDLWRSTLFSILDHSVLIHLPGPGSAYVGEVTEQVFDFFAHESLQVFRLLLFRFLRLVSLLRWWKATPKRKSDLSTALRFSTVKSVLLKVFEPVLLLSLLSHVTDSRIKSIVQSICLFDEGKQQQKNAWNTFVYLHQINKQCLNNNSTTSFRSINEDCVLIHCADCADCIVAFMPTKTDV